jgi:transcription elongation factor GreB
MSKAFTREDDSPESPEGPRRVSPLPPGAKNYVTPGGLERMRAELERLQRERSQAAGADGEPESARRAVQSFEQRLAYLHESLRTAEVVAPPPPPHEEVRFGATVRVRDRKGVETGYRLVGVDETDLDRDWVSWCSPIARALLRRRLGEKVRFRFPAGEEELEIVAISFD